MNGAEKGMPILQVEGLKKSFGKLEVLRGIPEIAIVTLDRSDVVRHDLVQTVVRAYETYESTRKGGGNDAR